MARKPRIEYEGAVYHVMSRGDRGGKIFKDRLDYELFVGTMEEVCSRAGWRIHAYALLPNHFHWQLETPEGNLVAGMKWFLSVYTQRFNNRHGRRGHVFQGRYKAVLIETDSGDYFETLSTYIHLNPARAGLIDDLKKGLTQYEWSSFPQYLQGRRERSAWLEVKRVLGNVRLRDDAQGRRAYGEYLHSRMKELFTRKGRKAYREEWKALRYGWCAGSEEFQESLQERLAETVAGKQRASYSGEAIRQHDTHQAENLIRRGMALLGVRESDLAGLAKGHDVKCALAWLAHKRTMVTHAWLADRLGMGFPTTLSAYIARVGAARSGPLVTLRKRLAEITL